MQVKGIDRLFDRLIDFQICDFDICGTERDAADVFDNENGKVFCTAGIEFLEIYLELGHRCWGSQWSEFRQY